jgi:glycosyltransferase involved in cell wall biosynthesis
VRIAYIAAGAGGMLCGSCIRDNALVGALQRLGHEALLVPIYTPLRTDEDNVEVPRIFYGAINVYLQQRSQLFARLPAVLRHALDRPGLLRRLPTDGAVDAAGLGALALSMLQGQDGRQRLELDELTEWLRTEVRPEVIQLTNSMLLGLVRSLRERLPETRIVCALQGEDLFLDDLREPWRGRVLDAMRERARDCDLYLATSDYYAGAMAELLALPRERVRTARLGINLEGYPARGAEPPERPFTIGYLARICHDKGAHVLLEAFRLLAAEHPPGSLRLRIAGYRAAKDREYQKDLERRARGWGLGDVVEMLGEVDRDGKLELLRSLHVFSVPTVYREPKGLPVLEAMATGVPVVQPAHGSFPEIVERTGGGVLVPPDDPKALAQALGELMADGGRRRELGTRGQRGVREHYAVEKVAEETLAVYREILGATQPPSVATGGRRASAG